MIKADDIVSLWNSVVPTPALPDRIAETLQEDGRSLCFAQDVIRNSEYWPLRQCAIEFSVSKKVRQAEEDVRNGVNREDRKQFLVKYGERNDLLIGMFTRLQPIIDKACGEGMQPYHCDMWYVIPTPDKPRDLSQNWHRDRDGSTVVKVFCYFWDVTEESGPLQYVVGSHAGKYVNVIADPAKSYPAPGECDVIKDEDVATLLVPAGTLAFVNTTGLHRGGYAMSQPRLCAVWTFVRK